MRKALRWSLILVAMLVVSIGTFLAIITYRSSHPKEIKFAELSEHCETWVRLSGCIVVDPEGSPLTRKFRLVENCDSSAAAQRWLAIYVPSKEKIEHFHLSFPDFAIGDRVTLEGLSACVRGEAVSMQLEKLHIDKKAAMAR